MKTIRRDLALKVSEITGYRKSASAEMVSVLFDEMRETLIAGHRIEIPGFGVFEVKDTRPKPKARNPYTGETIYVRAHRKILFKPGKTLKEELNRPIKRKKRMRK